MYKQIIHILAEKFDLKLSESGQQGNGNTTEQNELILQCLCSGFKNNVVRKGQDDRSYEKCGIVARIHPSSGVRGGNCLLYHQIVQTTDNYMRIVSVVKESWL